MGLDHLVAANRSDFAQMALKLANVSSYRIAAIKSVREKRPMLLKGSDAAVEEWTRFLQTVGRDAAAHRVEIMKREEREREHTKGQERDRKRKERRAAKKQGH
jgi:hypothetical protein